MLTLLRQMGYQILLKSYFYFSWSNFIDIIECFCGLRDSAQYIFRYHVINFLLFIFFVDVKINLSQYQCQCQYYSECTALYQTRVDPLIPFLTLMRGPQLEYSVLLTVYAFQECGYNKYYDVLIVPSICMVNYIIPYSTQ